MRNPARLLSSWLETRRRHAIVGIAVLAVIALVLVVADPFGSGPSGSGVSDNEYPTSTATVTEQDLSSQSNVSATLGYAGTYSLTIPIGTAATALTQAQQAVSADALKVANDTSALALSKATAKPSNNSTLLAAQATVTTDETAIATANAQLASDEQLGCPPSSSATVTTAVNGSSSPSSGSPSSSSGSPSSDSGSPSSGSTPSGSTGTAKAHLTADVAGAPVATTGSASGATSTGATLSGSVDPNGLSTQYEFEYGTTRALGSTTTSTDAGSGTSATTVSVNVSGLSPDTTYDFVLVATNADGTSVGGIGSFQTSESSCVAERVVITEDETSLSEAKDALSVDKLGGSSSVTSAEQTLSSDEATLAAAKQALSDAQMQATNPATTFTALPASGKVISRGQSVYSLNGNVVPLFYGATTLYRALYLGVTDGPDVAEIQRNLIALGFGSGIIPSNHFSAATQAAVEAWQRTLGVPATGVVALGDVVLEPGPIEVDTVSATAGSAASAGAAVLTATSTTREVTIELDASQQGQVKVGDPVTVTLPDNSTTPGVVSSVGSVAVAPSSAGGGNTGQGSAPTITVEVTLTNPKATGNLDQAPVEVSITNASMNNALVVPVDALISLSSGGYALEVVGAHGVHSYESVTLGLFDDADGLVQVSGSQVQAGQKIVVPNT